MRKRLALVAVSFLLSPFAFAEPAAAPAAAKDEIPALIKQLGDDSPKLRDEASEKLRHLGADALPALKDAMKSDDAEVVTRAQSISRMIDEELHPKPKTEPDSPQLVFPRGFGRGGLVVGGGNGNVQIHISSTVMNGNGKSVSVTKTNNGTVKETTVKENGKTTKIREDAEGIAVTISEMKDGKEVAETTKAKDKETLKKENPKIFEIYEKNTKDGVQINGLPGQLRIQRGFGPGQRPEEIEKLLQEAQKRADARFKEMQKNAEEAIKQIEKPAEEAKPGEDKKADAPEVSGGKDAAGSK